MIATLTPSSVIHSDPSTTFPDADSSASSETGRQQKTLVVIGNGMVGLCFCEKLITADPDHKFKIVTFCEEPRAAYDRVGLTSFFAHRDAEKLLLAKKGWYEEHGVELHVGDRAHFIDREHKVVRSVRGCEVKYDTLVLATGSFPFVPPVPGVEKQGVFVYRTIEDLERMIAYAKDAKSCLVIGGSLLGLEVTKAVYDLGLEVHIVEDNPRLMPRQIDDVASTILVKQIEAMGVHVHLNRGTKEIHGTSQVEAVEFNDGTQLEVGMVVISSGVLPRDELAKQSGLHRGPRGGFAVNDLLQTSDPNVYAIGECAAHVGMTFGLVAPGDEMVETLTSVLTGGGNRFRGSDMSTTLKLIGVDVASFGQVEIPHDQGVSLTFEDPLHDSYKKLIVSPDGKRLLGGILIGDTSEYGTLSILAKTGDPLPCEPHELMIGQIGGEPDRGGVARQCRVLPFSRESPEN